MTVCFASDHQTLFCIWGQSACHNLHQLWHIVLGLCSELLIFIYHMVTTKHFMLVGIEPKTIRSWDSSIPSRTWLLPDGKRRRIRDFEIQFVHESNFILKFGYRIRIRTWDSIFVDQIWPKFSQNPVKFGLNLNQNLI